MSRTLNLEAVGVRVDVPGRTLFSGVDLAIGSGQSFAILGPSGSGKTSLLNALAGIIPSQAERLVIADRDICGLSPVKTAAFRLRRVGLIFQFAELLPEFDALENVSLPLRFAGIRRAEAEARALHWLERVGLTDRAHAAVDSLSGGERQRVAVARALSPSPVLVLADEPTGSLDRSTADVVAQLLVDTTVETGAALVVATHDPLVAQRCDRVFNLTDHGLAEVRL